MSFLGVAKMRITWLGHSCFGGRKEGVDVVCTAGKGGDLEQVRGSEGDDAVVEKAECKDL